MLKKHNIYLKYFLKIPFKITKVFMMFIKNIKIYTITLPPFLRNVGDRAQVIAIKKWFMENFNEYLVLEFDKNEIYKYLYMCEIEKDLAKYLYWHLKKNFLRIENKWSLKGYS